MWRPWEQTFKSAFIRREEALPKITIHPGCSVKTYKTNMRQFERKFYKCIICGISLPDAAERMAHKHFNLVSPLPKVKCKLCRFETSDIKLFTQHNKWHFMTVKKYQCRLCDVSTDDLFFINLHIDCAHIKEIPFTCGYCNYVTHRIEIIWIHYKQVHDLQLDYLDGAMRRHTRDM